MAVRVIITMQRIVVKILSKVEAVINLFCDYNDVDKIK